jgi:hypothetical protein
MSILRPPALRAPFQEKITFSVAFSISLAGIGAKNANNTKRQPDRRSCVPFLFYFYKS